jgi:precorrin-6x reductase
VVIDHQHPYQADTSSTLLKACWLLAFSGANSIKKIIELADHNAGN